MKRKALHLDVSRVSKNTSKAISVTVIVTILGSKKPTEGSNLFFLTAGDKSLYGKVGPLLNLMGELRFYIDNVGNNATIKLMVNMIMGSMMASVSKGLVLDQEVRLDSNILLKVLPQQYYKFSIFSLKSHLW